MKKETALLEKLKPFIRPHPELYPDAGDIFTPVANKVIRFLFEGGFVVEGSAPELEINFNDDDLLILATGSSIFRFKRSAFLGFELRLLSARPDSADLAEIKGFLH